MTDYCKHNLIKRDCPDCSPDPDQSDLFAQQPYAVGNGLQQPDDRGNLLSSSRGNGASVEHLRREALKPLDICAGCGGNLKVYRRKLNAGMGAILCWLTSNREPDVWSHLSEVPRNILKSREFGKLMYWGFLDQQPTSSDDKHSSGKWRPTPIGRRFANEEFSVWSHAFVQIPGGDFLGWETSTTDIVEVVEYRNRFKYGELMRGEG